MMLTRALAFSFVKQEAEVQDYINNTILHLNEGPCGVEVMKSFSLWTTDL